MGAINGDPIGARKTDRASVDGTNGVRVRAETTSGDIQNPVLSSSVQTCDLGASGILANSSTVAPTSVTTQSQALTTHRCSVTTYNATAGNTTLADTCSNGVGAGTSMLSTSGNAAAPPASSSTTTHHLPKVGLTNLNYSYSTTAPETTINSSSMGGARALGQSCTLNVGANLNTSSASAVGDFHNRRTSGAAESNNEFHSRFGGSHIHSANPNHPVSISLPASERQTSGALQHQRQQESSAVEGSNDTKTYLKSNITTSNLNTPKVTADRIANASAAPTPEEPRAISAALTGQECMSEGLSKHGTVRVISRYLDYDNQRVTERVVGREYGESRVIEMTERVDEGNIRVISETWKHHEIRVPVRGRREEIIERVVVIPEKKLVEEIIEEAVLVKERIQEWAKPKILERIREIAEVEVREKIVEEIVKKVVEREVKKDKVIFQDKISEVVEVIPREKVVEVPDVQYRDKLVERVVYVDEVIDEVREVKVPVPQKREILVPELKEVVSYDDIDRTIPLPVESETTAQLVVPELRPRYQKFSYPVYLPKFIEVPVTVDLLDQQLQQQSAEFLTQVNNLTTTVASLCDIETVASNILSAQHLQAVNNLSGDAIQQHIMETFNTTEPKLSTNSSNPREAPSTSVTLSTATGPATTATQPGTLVIGGPAKFSSNYPAEAQPTTIRAGGSHAQMNNASPVTMAAPSGAKVDFNTRGGFEDAPRGALEDSFSSQQKVMVPVPSQVPVM